MEEVFERPLLEYTITSPSAARERDPASPAQAETGRGEAPENGLHLAGSEVAVVKGLPRAHRRMLTLLLQRPTSALYVCSRPRLEELLLTRVVNSLAYDYVE